MNVRSMMPWTRERAGTPATTGGGEPFLALHREMNRLFDDMLRGVPGAATGGFDGAGGWPSVEVEDTGKDLRVTAELPGMTSDDVELTLRDNVLSLRGERTREGGDESRRISERFYGRFERHIPLGVDVDEANVNGEFKDGVLTVTLPKTEGAGPEARRISIKAS